MSEHHHHQHLLRPTLDELLAAHAAGSLPLPVALAVATHLTLSPRSRRQYRVYEALGGVLLERIAPVSLAPDAWEKLRARLEGDAGGTRNIEALPPSRGEPAPTAGGPDLLLPRPLRDRLPGPIESLHWRARTPAVREAGLDLGTPGFDTALIHVREGQPYPGHDPREVDLVLTLEGGSHGQAGHFARGDLAILGPDDSRLRTADGGRDWLWLRVLGAL